MVDVAGLVVGLCVKDCMPPREVMITPGTGQLDFPAMMAGLRKGGFTSGPLIVECLTRGETPATITAEAKKARRFLIKRSRVWVTDAAQELIRDRVAALRAGQPRDRPAPGQAALELSVDNREQIGELSRGMKVLIEPFDAGFCVAGFYEPQEGAILEFVWYYDEMTAWAERTRPHPRNSPSATVAAMSRELDRIFSAAQKELLRVM